MLLHLGVEVLLSFAGFLFGFLVIFIDEIIKFDGLLVCSHDLSLLGFQEERDTSNNSGFNLKIWVKGLILDTELPKSEFFSTMRGSCNEFELWLHILLPDFSSEEIRFGL